MKIIRGQHIRRIALLLLITVLISDLLWNSIVVASPKDNNTEIFPLETMTLVEEQYKLAKYDVLNIVVEGFNGIDVVPKGIIIGPDGYVNLPYVGSIKLAGLTVPEASAMLTKRLGEYVKEPILSVIIASYGPRKVYVMGEVNTPGLYSLTSDYLNIFAAISSAGGIKKKGRPKHIALVRVIDGKVYMREVNFDRFVMKQDSTQNVKLLDGDMIYVPLSAKIDFFGEVMPVVNSYLLFRNATK
jgi:polysaccharide export outer membrane protein